MAGVRLPGSVGHELSQAIDPGTLPRTPTPRPGPIGLFSGPVKPTAKSKGAAPKAVPAPKFSIEVHEKSLISAEEWLKKIKACDDVPDYFKNQIDAKDRLIFVLNAKHFRFPKDVIAKDWLNDWLSAFVGEEWQMTTGNLDITVKKSAAGSKAPPDITGDLQPDLSSGEKIDGFTKFAGLTMKGHSTKDFAVEYGDTMPDGVELSSTRKKLIVVANRITLNLVDKATKTLNFTVTDSELVNTWFHEIACHAGRDTEGKPSGHGDHDVDAAALDINEMISKRETTDKIAAAISDFLTPSKPAHP